MYLSSAYISIHVPFYMPTCTIYKYRCAYLHVPAQLYIPTCVSLHTYIPTCTYQPSCLHIYMYIPTCLPTYICIFPTSTYILNAYLSTHT